ncbi:hypothetical protein [Psychroflexus sp. ALD_RP9]|uniref:hypothetical protein n=1 Tax=Psychroflexus sp. ALD_RP9 TaxID=2777186 RepID=UPI001A8C5457|nr:hypothetical protein [Psychroflexus sp. ALD_RP9]QSS97762.1 hypothetical protein IMZ30_03350 [Psychroflexus sp. ALD_RP9]
MRISLLIICFISLLSFSVNAQPKTDNHAYNYVEVPYKFSFFEENNQFQLNILARVLLQEKGFEVYMDVEDLPLEVLKSPCQLLKFELNEIDSFMRKRLQFNLIDCYGQVVYTSEVGESRKKKFKDSYTEALKNSFLGFTKLDLKQLSSESTPSNSSQTETLSDEITDITKKLNYKHKDQVYWLIEDGKNYKLVTSTDQSVFATLDKADRGTYIFTAKSFLGAAFFKPNGDLIVEYRDNNQTNSSTKSIEFKKI